MSASASRFPRRVPGVPERRRLVMRTCLLTCCAVVLTAGWVLVMLAAARALRPPQLDDLPAYHGDVQPLVDAALLYMRILLLVSVLAIVTLAALAIRSGRRALRAEASAATLARLERWAVVSLAGGLAIWLVPLVVTSARGRSFASADWGELLASLALAGAVGSAILSGIALRRTAPTPERASRHQRAWRIGARICLVIAPLILLAGFFIFAVVAEFFVAFYLRD